MRKGRLTSSLAVVGMAFYWPLFRRNYFCSLFPLQSNADFDPAFYFLFLFCIAVLSVIGARFHKSLRTMLHTQPWILAAAAGVSVLCYVALLVFSDGVFALALSVVVTLCGAACLVLLTFAWGDYVSGMSLARSLPRIALSFMLSFVVALPTACIEGSNLVMTLFSVVVSGVLWMFTPRNTRTSSEGMLAMLRSVSSKMALLLIAFLLVGGFVRGAIGSGVLGGFQGIDPYALHKTAFSLGLSIVVLVMVHFLNDNERFAYACWSVIAVVFFAGLFFIASSSPDAWGLVGTIVIPSRTFLSFILWTVLTRTAQQRSVSAIFALGCLFLPTEALAWFLSDFGVMFVTEVFGLDMQNSLEPLSLLMALLLIVAVFVFMRVASPQLVDCQASAACGLEDARGAAVARLREEYGLTHRESEVLLLMSQGHSYRRISEELFVSESTTQTHAKSMYRKLNLHSKQGIIDLVDSTMR